MTEKANGCCPWTSCCKADKSCDELIDENKKNTTLYVLDPKMHKNPLGVISSLHLKFALQCKFLYLFLMF